MSFLHSIVFALPGYMAFMVLRGFTSAIERPGPVMVISLIGALANFALNYAFIEDCSACRAWGWRGSAWSPRW